MDIKYKQSHGGRESFTPVHYKKDRTPDCAIRAIAQALPNPYPYNGPGLIYCKVRDDLFALAKKMWRMPHDDVVVDEYMTKLGYKKHSPLTYDGKTRYKIGEFPIGGATGAGRSYIIRSQNHWSCIRDGVLLDTFDCRRSKAQSYYVVFDHTMPHTHGYGETEEFYRNRRMEFDRAFDYPH